MNSALDDAAVPWSKTTTVLPTSKRFMIWGGNLFASRKNPFFHELPR
jgi:hypothetical protein